MKPVDMEQSGDDGDCLMASLASILECRVSDLPYVNGARNDQWQEIVRSTVRHFGFRSIEVSNDPPLAPPGYHIAIGFNTEDAAMRSVSHACVALNGDVVHDPQRRRDGVVRIDWWVLLIPLARSPQLVSPSQAVTAEHRL